LIIEAMCHEQTFTKGCFYRDTMEIQKKSENHILVSLNSAKNYTKSFYLFSSARGKLTELYSVNYHCRYTWCECASHVKDSIISWRGFVGI